MPSDEDLARARLLDAMETDLAGVELALARLDAGTYFTCEACGADLPESLLVQRPTTRRCADHAEPQPGAAKPHLGAPEPEPGAAEPHLAAPEPGPAETTAPGPAAPLTTAPGPGPSEPAEL